MIWLLYGFALLAAILLGVTLANHKYHKKDKELWKKYERKKRENKEKVWGKKK